MVSQVDVISHYFIVCYVIYVAELRSFFSLWIGIVRVATICYHSPPLKDRHGADLFQLKTAKEWTT